MLESIIRSILNASDGEVPDNDVEPDEKKTEKTMATVSGMSPRFSAANVGNFRTDSVYGMLCGRETGTPHSGLRKRMHQYFVPKHVSHYAAQYDQSLFVGQFSPDGEVYLSACQDARLRLFTKNSIIKNRQTSFRCPELKGVSTRTGLGSRSTCRVKPVTTKASPYKEVIGRDIGWSIIDTSFNPDYSFLVYSAWCPYVYLCNVFGDEEMHKGLPFQTEDEQEYSGAICFFSLQFSQDSKEIIAGANDGHIYVYDVERNRRVHHFEGHQDDINAVTFVDNKCNCILSGSDDSLIKIWDRRMLQDNCKAVGILASHKEGITHIHSRNDGRYVISNSKDDTIRLWDLRKYKSAGQERALRRRSSYDYRFSHVERRSATRLRPTLDDSVQIYTGHTVRQTLIRAYFSPIESTGGAYIYSGSANGQVYIYDTLSGEKVKTIPCHEQVIRDLSWHPQIPIIATASWDGRIAVLDATVKGAAYLKRRYYHPRSLVGVLQQLEGNVNLSSYESYTSNDDDDDDDVADEEEEEEEEEEE